MTSTRTIADCHLYLCTPDRPDLAAFVTACVRGGVDIVQLRDKHLDARTIVLRAAVVRDICATAGIPFILNDRPDLALEVAANGVHVGQDDAPPHLARRILGHDAIVGLSTHEVRDLDAAPWSELSYISAGPVEATPTKPGRPGTGLDYLRTAVERSALPVFVTGGVTPERIETLGAAGARHFVVVRYLCDAQDPLRSAQALRSVIDRLG